jgi:phosphatidylserine/phosphatidylglycerophosphate/cardiolipin synthase-like enzyme
VVVRVVTDDHDGLGDSLTTLHQLEAAKIPIVTDNRSALMHDKIMIMDSTYIVTGSWNYSINDTYRNNNNALVIASPAAVQDYQAEFNEMFVDKKFGPTSPANTPHPEFTQDGTPIGIYFSPEDDVLSQINATLQGAQHQIRFMTFSFTEDPIGQTLIAKAGAGVDVEGIFEKTGSETKFSELTSTFCAGLQVRQDGNPFVLHHKVFIVDGQTVISGSFNVSNNATTSNDENMIRITDPDLAAQYLAEFDRRWAEATVPTKLSCS